MTDLEITKRCAEAMGVEAHLVENSGLFIFTRGFGSVALAEKYDPLHDDAQAMALVKKFRLRPAPVQGGVWSVHGGDNECGSADDLNRAICLCVAKMGST